MSKLALLTALLLGAVLGACSPDEKTLRELSTVESLEVCNSYVDESRACVGFDMRCPEQVQGVCTRKQLVDTCLEGLAWSTCPVTRFERCFSNNLCQVQDDGGVLPCFVQCMTESNAETQ